MAMAMTVLSATGDFKTCRDLMKPDTPSEEHGRLAEVPAALATTAPLRGRAMAYA